MQDGLDAFAAEAEAFVAWFGQPPADEAAAAREALVRLTRLFLAGLGLPAPDPAAWEKEPDAPSVSHEEWDIVFRSLAWLPVDFYSCTIDPLEVPGSELVVGSVADDLADVWGDVEGGLRAWRRGHRAAACWAWGFHFRCHWGRHATQAMEALRAWLEANEPGRLTGDAPA